MGSTDELCRITSDDGRSTEKGDRMGQSRQRPAWWRLKTTMRGVDVGVGTEPRREMALERREAA